MGSQWAVLVQLETIESNILTLVTSLAAEFWMYCILLKSVSGTTVVIGPLLLSKTDKL